MKLPAVLTAVNLQKKRKCYNKSSQRSAPSVAGRQMTAALFLLCHTGKQSHCRCRRDPGCPAQSRRRPSSMDPCQHQAHLGRKVCLNMDEKCKFGTSRREFFKKVFCLQKLNGDKIRRRVCCLPPPLRWRGHLPPHCRCWRKCCCRRCSPLLLAAP